MSGKIIGAVAGAAIAFFTGGIGLVGIGAALGGAIGSLFDPKQIIEGPRLEDLKVQVSTYGVGIPKLYGTERFGGNVIWSTDKLEIATDTSAGKGGSAVNRNYKYYVHMSLLLCETPTDGSEVSIIKFLQDGKLTWDVSSGTPIAQALASAENPYSAFVLFQGHNDQLPDPIEESWTGGPGTCSAYRGVVRIRMIAIECPGGRVPQFSFVLSNGATVTTQADVVATLTGYDPTPDHNAYASVAGFNANSFEMFRNSGPGTLVYQTFRDGQWLDREKTLGPALPTYTRGGWGTESAWVGFDAPTLTFTIMKVSGSQVVVSPVDVGIGGIPLLSFNGTNYAGVAGGASSPNWFVSSGYGAFSGSFTAITQSACVSADRAYFVRQAPSNDIAMVDLATGSVSTLAAPAGSGVLQHAQVLLDGADLYFFSNSVQTLWKLQGGAWVVWMTGITAGYSFFDSLGVSAGLLYAQRKSNPQSLTIYRRVYSIGTAKVKDIIADQCERAGILTYDVSGIPDSDKVIGYKIANPASARANIEPLLTLIGGYVVDEDGVTKFKKFSDITSVASVSFDELGQAEGDASGEAMPLNRTQEVDLPRSVTTSYIEPTNDYQTAAETEVRQVTEATEDVQISLAVCITSDQAKKVSQMSLYDRWRRQNTRSTSVSRKFAAVSPGDGVTIEYPRGTFKLWLVLSTNDTGAVCEWSLCPGDSSIFTQTAIGATGYVSQSVSPMAPQTKMILLDAPIVQDADNNAGLYVAGEGYSATGWPGYTLEVGDDDSNLEGRGSAQNPTTIGYAESALGAWSLNMMDGQNSVVINIGDGSLSSTTEAQLMTSRINLAAIGADGRWEYVQFMTASSLGGGRFLVYQMLRGLYGTERFAGTHQAGDDFVLMSVAGMLRPNMDVGSVGQVKSYRGVTIGRSVDSTTSQRFANHAVGLVPLSPWNAGKGVAANNDQTITWERRTRLSTNALRGIVPLGETSERYTVGFYTSGAFTTLAGTLTSTTNALTITSAQQTGFGLTPGGPLFLRISQISDSIGVGTPLEVTI